MFSLVIINAPTATQTNRLKPKPEQNIKVSVKDECYKTISMFGNF